MTRKTSRRGRRRLPAITRGQLRRDNRDLRHHLDGAERYMSGQAERIAERNTRIGTLEAAVAQLQADQVDAGVLAKQLDTEQADNKRLTADYNAVKARLQNATAIDVPPMHRDTSHPDDQATEQIYAQTLWDSMVRQERQQATPQVKPLADAFGGVV